MKKHLYIFIFTCIYSLCAMESPSLLSTPPVNLALVMGTSPKNIHLGFNYIQLNEFKAARKIFLPLCSSPDINTRIYAYVGLAKIEEKLENFANATEDYFLAIQQCPSLFSSQRESLSLYLATLLIEKRPDPLKFETLSYMRQITSEALSKGNLSYVRCNTVLINFYGI